MDGTNLVRVPFRAAPGPFTRAQMVYELICSALYLKQQIPCPLRDIEAQAQGDGRRAALRKYRLYLDGLYAIKEDLLTLFQNECLQVLELQVLFGVSWTTPKDGVILSFVDCQPVINEETIDELEDSKSDAYCRKLLRAAIPIVGAHTLAMNKLHLVVKAIQDPELEGSGWCHQLKTLLMARSAPKLRKIGRNCREPSAIDLIAPTDAYATTAGHHYLEHPSTTPVLQIYDDMASRKRQLTVDEAPGVVEREANPLNRTQDQGLRQGKADTSSAKLMKQSQSYVEEPSALNVVWLHSRRGMRGLQVKF